MSLLPFFANAFGHALHPEQLFSVIRQPSLINSNLLPSLYQGLTKSVIGKDGFQVSVDVQHFQPNELTVKTVDDNSVVIEGKHEEKEDDFGRISRHFLRRYQLPQEIDVKNVISSLSSDGVLTIKAPLKPGALETNERVIPIQQTGPAHLSIKPNENEKSEKDKGATGGATA